MPEALYRKYRPQVFDDVVGQENITRTLRNAVREGKVSHAYLFCGPRGTGKTTTARLLAKALLCEKGPTDEPCGKCQECVDIANGVHPDVYELDAASRTGVDNVRDEIISRVNYAPTRGRDKVYIIDEVHMLSTAAFNALLKTLEEPPAHVVFILCTTDPQKVPPTIQSRCQRFDFHRISDDEIVQRLGFVCAKEGIDYDPDALGLIAQHAQGGMRNALTLLEQLSAFGDGKVTMEGAQAMLGTVGRSDMAALMGHIAERDVAACFSWVADYVERGADLAQFAGDMAQHVRNAYVLSLAGTDAAVEVDDAERAELVDELKAFGPDRLSRLLGVLGEVLAQLKTSTNPRLCFEVALTRMVRPECDLTLAGLAERVEALEQARPATATVSRAAAGEGAARAARPANASGQTAPAGFSGAPSSAPSGFAGAPSSSPATPRPAASSAPSMPQVTPAAPARPVPNANPAAPARPMPNAAPVPGRPAARPSAQVDVAAPRPVAEPPAPVGPAAAAPVPPSSAPAATDSGSPSAPVAAVPADRPVGVAQPSGTGAAPSASQPAATAEQVAALKGVLGNPAALQRAWQQALAQVKKKKMPLSVMFMGVKASADVDHGRVVLTFQPNASIAMKAAQKPENQAIVLDALRAEVGPGVTVEYTQAGGPQGASRPSSTTPAARRPERQASAPQPFAAPGPSAQAGAAPARQGVPAPFAPAGQAARQQAGANSATSATPAQGTPPAQAPSAAPAPQAPVDDDRVPLEAYEAQGGFAEENDADEGFSAAPKPSFPVPTPDFAPPAPQGGTPRPARKAPRPTAPTRQPAPGASAHPVQGGPFANAAGGQAANAPRPPFPKAKGNGSDSPDDAEAMGRMLSDTMGGNVVFHEVGGKGAGHTPAPRP